MEITPASADVWGFELDVTAKSRGSRMCWVSNGTAKVPAAPAADSFTARVSLEPGPNSVTAICRDATGVDHRCVRVTYVGKIPDTPEARALLHLEGETLTLDGSKSCMAELSQARLSRFEWFVQKGLSAPASKLGEGTTIRIRMPPLDGEYSYTLRVSDVRGASDRAVVALDGGSSSWASTGVVYGISATRRGEASRSARKSTGHDLAVGLDVPLR